MDRVPLNIIETIIAPCLKDGLYAFIRTCKAYNTNCQSALNKYNNELVVGISTVWKGYRLYGPLLRRGTGALHCMPNIHKPDNPDAYSMITWINNGVPAEDKGRPSRVIATKDFENYNWYEQGIMVEHYVEDDVYAVYENNKLITYAIDATTIRLCKEALGLLQN